MGITNFIKRQAGIGRLPDSQLNEVTVAKVLNMGAPFVVNLPIWETQRVGASTSLSKSMGGGFRQSVYTPAPTRKVQRKVKTAITYDLKQLKILHAQKNGKHIIIKSNQIARVGKGPDGLTIEHSDGRVFQFIMDKDIKNRWKQLGFNPQFPIDIMYNIFSGVYLREAQQKYQTTDFNEIMRRANQTVNGVPKQAIPPKKLESQKTKTTRKRKTKKSNDENPLEKIKQAKELLDIGAITQEEFEAIKSKYLNQI